MKRRLLSLALALVMALALLPTAVFAADSDFLISGSRLTRYTGPGGDVVIPDGVISIGRQAFASIGEQGLPGPSNLTSVTIPDSVRSIESMAFWGCGSLTSVTFGSGVTSIGDDAFWGCDLTSVTLPNSVTGIGKGAFKNNSRLSSLTIGGSVTRIEEETFTCCRGLTSVTIPDGVTSIGDQAFSACSGLTSVTIPSSVTEIGGNAFAQTPWLEAQGDFAVANGILLKYQGSDSHVTIPRHVTKIGAQAFGYYLGDMDRSSYKLTSVTIPDGVTSIGKRAFDNCPSLTSVTFPKSVTKIGEDAFSGTPWLNAQGDFVVANGVLLQYQGPGGKVDIPDKVTQIGDRAFWNCTSLTGVTIPDGVTSIGDGAFIGTSLTSVTIPDGVTSIGAEAFYACTSLTGVTIGNGVTSIGGDAFYDCPGLTSVTIADGATSILAHAFRRCPNLTSVTIPDGVTSIGDGAFSGCTSLTGVTIPDSVTSIGDDVFSGCTSLTGVTVPNSVVKIGKWAFDGCTSLKTAVLPFNVDGFMEDDFMYSIFKGCTQLQKVVYTDTGRTWTDSRLGIFSPNESPNLAYVIGYPDPDYYTYLAKNWSATASADPKDCVSPQSERITTLSNQICAGLTDPYEKAKAIFTWMAQNIEYDWDYYEGRKSTVTIAPEEVLNSRLTVCDGYARLTQALLQAQGIPAIYISGLANNGSWGDHAWNAAYINGRWVYLDSTWGRPTVHNFSTGEVSSDFDPKWFDINLYALTVDHHGGSGGSARTVAPNRAAVLVNGEKVDFEAYTINGNNYFKLRDLAKALSGTEKQFDVTWDGTKGAINLISGKAYTVVGGELAQGDGKEKQATPNAAAAYLDGGQFFLPAYTINSNNFVKLRDLGGVIDFNVTWDGANQMILIDTSKAYTAD